MLVAVDGIAIGKHRRAGKAGVGDLVTGETAFLRQVIARPDRGSIEPPFLTREDQVRSGNLADAGGVASMAIVHRDGEALRRNDSAEFGIPRELLVPVQRVGIVHRLHPAADVRRIAVVPHLGKYDGLADPLVDIAGIERHVRFGHFNPLPYLTVHASVNACFSCGATFLGK